MNIQNLVQTTIASQMTRLGSELVVIGTQTVNMVLAESQVDTGIHGGSREERTLTATFPSDSTLALKTGKKVTARGKTWKIERVEKGQAITTLNLIEPNRAENI